jgi:hypothetical protein
VAVKYPIGAANGLSAVCWYMPCLRACCLPISSHQPDLLMALRQELLCKSKTQNSGCTTGTLRKTGLVSRRFTSTFTFNIGANSPAQGIVCRPYGCMLCWMHVLLPRMCLSSAKLCLKLFRTKSESQGISRRSNSRSVSRTCT